MILINQVNLQYPAHILWAHLKKKWFPNCGITWPCNTAAAIELRKESGWAPKASRFLHTVSVLATRFELNFSEVYSPTRKCLSASYTRLHKTPLTAGFWGTPAQGWHSWVDISLFADVYVYRRSLWDIIHHSLLSEGWLNFTAVLQVQSIQHYTTGNWDRTST